MYVSYTRLFSQYGNQATLNMTLAFGIHAKTSFFELTYAGAVPTNWLFRTEIVLAVCVLYTIVFLYEHQVNCNMTLAFGFECQNQGSFNMAVFDRDPRCHIATCFWYSCKNVVFWLLKASVFSTWCFWREGVLVPFLLTDFFVFLTDYFVL